MNLDVNGETQEVEEGWSVVDLVRSIEPERWERGVAVALNGEVLPRSQWARTTLAPGDRVEVLAAIGGG